MVKSDTEVQNLRAAKAAITTAIAKGNMAVTEARLKATPENRADPAFQQELLNYEELTRKEALISSLKNLAATTNDPYVTVVLNLANDQALVPFDNLAHALVTREVDAKKA